MEDRASVLLLCKHFCFPPQEQPDACQEHRTPAQPGEEGNTVLGEGTGPNQICSSQLHFQAGTMSLMDYEPFPRCLRLLLQLTVCGKDLVLGQLDLSCHAPRKAVATEDSALERRLACSFSSA